MGRFDWLELPNLDGASKTEENAKSKGYPDRHDPEYCLQSAYKQFKEGDFWNALRDYSRTLHSDANNLSAWIGQVKSLLKMNELAEAKVWCEKALSLFPKSQDLIAAKALLLCKSGLREYAMSFSGDSLKGINDSYFPWLVRGEILLNGDQTKSAEFCFGKARELEKDTPMINFEIGEVYFNNKRFIQAVEYFKKSLEEQPSNFFRWFKLGEAYKQLAFYDLAKYAYKKAEELKPDFTDAGICAARLESRTTILNRLYNSIRSLFRGRRLNG